MQSSPHSDAETLDRLAASYAERLRQGERPALNEYIEMHPELEDSIREMFPALAMLENFGPTPEELHGPVNDGGSALKQLGEYDIIREVGRGGMGVVYEAEHRSLGRRVALKVLPSHVLLNANQVSRFQREARAAAQLHHTNIVPVFDVGQDQGTHYYAMQFIHGAALDDVMEKLTRLRKSGRPPGSAENQTHSASNSPATLLSNTSTTDGAFFFENVAQIGIQVAEALAYAHDQRILHRDIKPSNLILDSMGLVWVTDFGLAKEEDSGDLTRTGDIVGTLRYMAPERINGQLDRRADIYSLGLTLYELLTLKPAFEAQDRAQLIRQITQENPPRPKKIDPQIPRDLETIVLKSIASDPAKRYQFAGELAEDLKRFSQNRPIVARRTPLHERVWRWCSRNPALSSMAAMVLVTMIAGFVAVTTQWQRAERHLADAIENGNQADLNFKEADRQRRLAESNLEEAHKVVETYFTQVSENRLLNVPGLQPLRGELLESALRYYEEFIERNQNDPTLRLELARTYWRTARIHSAVGSRSQAVDNYRQALGVLGQLSITPDINRQAQLLHASIETNLGYEFMHSGQETQAVNLFESSIGRVGLLVDESTDGQKAHALWATNLHNLGYTHTLQKKYAIAEGLYQESKVIKEKLTATKPDTYQISFAQLLQDIGTLHTIKREFDEALDVHRHASRLRQQLVDRFPDVITYRAALADSHNRIGDVYRQSNRLREAIGPYEQAIEIQTEMVRANPSVSDYQSELANCYDNLGSVYAGLKQFNAAITNLERARDILTELQKNEPTNDTHVRSLAQANHSLGKVYRDRNDWTNSISAYRQAIALRESISKSPDSSDRLRVGHYCFDSSRALLFDGQLEEALVAGNKSVEIARHFVDLESSSESSCWYLVQALRQVAMVKRRQNAFAEALTLIDEAIATFDKTLSPNSPIPSHKGWYAFTWYIRGATLRDLQKLSAARESLKTAIDLQMKLLRNHPALQSRLENQDRFIALLAKTEIELGLLESASVNSLSRAQVWPNQAVVLLDVARQLSVIATLARDSANAEYKSEAARYIESSLDSLDAAVTAGFDDLDKIRSSSSMDILRDQPRYQAIEQRLLTGDK